MQGDWIYTIFNEQWHPSDDLENKLSKEEGKISRLFSRLGIEANPTTVDDRDELCSVLALQACRHPDVMGRVQRDLRGDRQADPQAALKPDSLRSA